MSKNYFCAIISHGCISYCLQNVAERLVGPESKIFYYSNDKLTLEEMESQIEEKREEINPDKTLFFVDLIGGSCWLLANRIKKNSPDIAVISGVNLSMLISYYINFNKLEWNELLIKIVEDAKKGIDTR